MIKYKLQYSVGSGGNYFFQMVCNNSLVKDISNYYEAIKEIDVHAAGREYEIVSVVPDRKSVRLLGTVSDNIFSVIYQNDNGDIYSEELNSVEVQELRNKLKERK